MASSSVVGDVSWWSRFFQFCWFTRVQKARRNFRVFFTQRSHAQSTHFLRQQNGSTMALQQVGRSIMSRVAGVYQSAVASELSAVGE